MATSLTISDRDYYESYIDEKAAAAFLACSIKTLQHWRLVGGGPVFIRKSKRFVRYRRRDLMAWAEAKTARSTSDQTGSSLTPRAGVLAGNGGTLTSHSESNSS